MANSSRKTILRRRRSSQRTPPPDGVRSGLREPVAPEDVSLREGKGGPKRGAGPGGEYWHVQVNDRRVGYVYVNVIDESPMGQHASLQIQIAKPWQGRGVGRIAYALAAKASHHSTIYLHMRRSNIASMRAAEHAGFREYVHPKIQQCVMMLTKKASESTNR
jgi:hypothetical protein